MNYVTEYFAKTLKAAREAKGISQRELSTKSGVPQGHISKIENGAVDLRVSSLVALARILDLELTLVPRKSVSAVQSIVRSNAGSGLIDSQSARQARRELARLQNLIDHLPRDLVSKIELERIQRQARELQHFRLTASDLNAVRNAYRSLTKFIKNPQNRNAISEVLSQLRERRNILSHGDETEAVQPAYSLDEDDHG